MPSQVKRQPTCPYGNSAKYVCVNKQCKKPGLICQKAEMTQTQCWLFHQNCTKIRWSEIQVFSKENPLTKTSQFLNLQQKIQNLFLKALDKIQSQHLKFKTWAQTYGHSSQSLKLIKILTDKNYDQLTGDNIAASIPILLSKENKRIQTPMIIESQFQSIRAEIEKVVEKVGSLYLRSKRPSQKLFVHSDFSNNQQINLNASQFNNSAFSQKHSFSTSSNHNLTSNFGAGTYSTIYNSTTPKQKLNKDLSTKQSSKQFTPTKQFKSNIIDSISSIENFFEGKVKSAELLYRASEQNFSIKKFHDTCDNIPNTLTLIHNQFNKKFGGYTPVAWTSDKKTWVADKSLKSFIFSIDMNKKFTLNLAQFAIASNPEKGPTFGCCDICIVDNSNKQKSNCEFPISYNNDDKYVRSQDTSIKFTGHSKGQFLVKQWEVFKLQVQ